MSRPWMPLALALAVVVVVSSSAHAQLRGMKFPASLVSVFMLRSGEVQTELALSDEQKKGAEALALQLQQDAFEIISSLQDLNPEEQKEAMPEIMKMVDEKGKEMQGKVDELLDDKQLTRLKQVSLQMLGPLALEEPEVVTALKLTDDQKAELAAIRDEGAAAMEKTREELLSKGGAQGDIRKRMGELRKKLGDKAMAVLTDDQRKEFEGLKGAEFKLPQGRGFPF